MRKRVFALLLCFTLPLSACGQGREEIPEPAPTVTAAPPPTPTPTPEPEPKSEEVTELWGFPIDDTHDAFEVPTGGKLGTVLVTVELIEEEEELHFSVWTADDLENPFQTMTAEWVWSFHWKDIRNANFDGYMDFGYMYAMGNQPAYYHYWIWDEGQGLFVAEPEFDQISWPQFDEETGVISGWARSSCCSGTETYHCWENDKLVCFRKVEYTYPDENFHQEKVVYERINGELVEVSREPYEMKG